MIWVGFVCDLLACVRFIALNVRARALKLRLGAYVHSAGQAEPLVAGCQVLIERNVTEKRNVEVIHGHCDGKLKLEEKEKLCVI